MKCDIRHRNKFHDSEPKFYVKSGTRVTRVH